MEFVKTAASNMFDVTSIWSIVLRAVIWIVISIIILIATDSPSAEQATQNTKSYLGFFVLFVVVSGSLLFLLFGVVPA